jgi:hypothetical protein
MKREEYLPPTDPDDPAYRSAKVAIDMVHDFASRDIIYDMWPIDDPIREAALCVVSAVKLKGDRTVEKALNKLPLDQKRSLVDTIRSVIEISVDKINHAGDGVRHIGTYKQPTAENPNALPKMDVNEQINQVADAAYWIGKHWVERGEEGLGVAERVHGAVHEVLSMIQNGHEVYEIPAFQLTPIDPETESGCVTAVERNGERVMAEWNFGQPMDLTWKPPVYGVDPKSPPGSLTDRYQNMYEMMRERYRTAARDLFGDPYDD